MFTIMENRKRPRLELINTNNNSNETIQGVASSTTTASTMGTATLATIGGQSFILSNSSGSTLPANILLSICDDNSDESEEYIIDSSILSQIKQENTVATQTSNTPPQQPQQQPQHQQQHQSSFVTTVPQYRIFNQAGKLLNNNVSISSSTSSVVNAPTISTNSSLISNSLNLPAGCEIYVIKEMIGSSKNQQHQIIAESTSPKTLTTTTSPNTNIKLEPKSPLPASGSGSFKIIRNSSLTGNTTIQKLNSTTTPNISSISINSASSSPGGGGGNNSSSSPPVAADDTVKRSLILEAYKKRDDKRRATHNEVERRRRDKINSWIFKLKEMLPSEITSPNTMLNKESSSSSSLCASTLAVNQNTSARLLVQQGTTRTPPSDSKSQILIKACEYIKSMQEEIKSLRECLTENENLRLSNQSLQDEINNLRNKHQQQQQHHQNIHNNNTILLNTTDHDEDDCEITLNSLNTTYANVQLFAPSANNTNLSGLVGLTTSSNTSGQPTVNVTYAKRELIIRDYVD